MSCARLHRTTTVTLINIFPQYIPNLCYACLSRHARFFVVLGPYRQPGAEVLLPLSFLESDEWSRRTYLFKLAPA